MKDTALSLCLIIQGRTNYTRHLHMRFFFFFFADNNSTLALFYKVRTIFIAKETSELYVLKQKYEGEAKPQINIVS